MVNINKYIKALLHPASGHLGSHKAHQAGNQKPLRKDHKWCHRLRLAYLRDTMTC